MYHQSSPSTSYIIIIGRFRLQRVQAEAAFAKQPVKRMIVIPNICVKKIIANVTTPLNWCRMSIPSLRCHGATQSQRHTRGQTRTELRFIFTCNRHQTPPSAVAATTASRAFQRVAFLQDKLPQNRHCRTGLTSLHLPCIVPSNKSRHGSFFPRR